MSDPRIDPGALRSEADALTSVPLGQWKLCEDFNIYTCGIDQCDKLREREMTAQHGIATLLTGGEELALGQNL